MLTAILLIFIGVQLNSPVWYFVLCGLSLFIRIIEYGARMYKAGSKI